MAHDLSTWEEIVHEFRDHQYYSIQLIIRKAEQRIAELDNEQYASLMEDETPFDNVEDLIAGYKEAIEANKIFRDTLGIDEDLPVEDIHQQLDQYVSAANDLADLDAVCVANLPSLTSGLPVDQVQHEFDRMRELFEDMERQRDFYKMMSGVK